VTGNKEAGIGQRSDCFIGLFRSSHVQTFCFEGDDARRAIGGKGTIRRVPDVQPGTTGSSKARQRKTSE
jgi:hypothetical protein